MSNAIVMLLNVAMLLFVARAILSWFPIGFDSPVRPIADGLNRITDPVLVPIRRVIPPIGGIDLSILVVIFGIRLILVPLIRSAF